MEARKCATLDSVFHHMQNICHGEEKSLTYQEVFVKGSVRYSHNRHGLFRRLVYGFAFAIGVLGALSRAQCYW